MREGGWGGGGVGGGGEWEVKDEKQRGGSFHLSDFVFIKATWAALDGTQARLKGEKSHWRTNAVISTEASLATTVVGA